MSKRICPKWLAAPISLFLSLQLSATAILFHLMVKIILSASLTSTSVHSHQWDAAAAADADDAADACVVFILLQMVLIYYGGYFIF